MGKDVHYHWSLGKYKSKDNNFTLSRMAMMQDRQTLATRGRIRFLIHFWWKCNTVQWLESQFFKKSNIELPRDSVPKKNENIWSHKICRVMYLVALFIIAEMLKHLKCLFTNTQTDKM